MVKTVESDPLASVPDPDTLRRMIAAQVEHTQALRQLLRVSLRRQRATDKSTVQSVSQMEGNANAPR